MEKKHGQHTGNSRLSLISASSWWEIGMSHAYFPGPSRCFHHFANCLPCFASCIQVRVEEALQIENQQTILVRYENSIKFQKDCRILEILACSCIQRTSTVNSGRYQRIFFSVLGRCILQSLRLLTWAIIMATHTGDKHETEWSRTHSNDEMCLFAM